MDGFLCRRRRSVPAQRADLFFTCRRSRVFKACACAGTGGTGSVYNTSDCCDTGSFQHITGHGYFLRNTCLFVFNRLNELSGRDPSDLLRVLMVGRQPWAEKLTDRNSVIPCSTDILRNRESHFFQLRHTPDIGKIIRIQNDCRGRGNAPGQGTFRQALSHGPSWRG